MSMQGIRKPIKGNLSRDAELNSDQAISAECTVISVQGLIASVRLIIARFFVQLNGVFGGHQRITLNILLHWCYGGLGDTAPFKNGTRGSVRELAEELF